MVWMMREYGSQPPKQGDADMAKLCKTIGKNMVVDCYMITTLTEGLQTQESQACRSKGKTDKGKSVVADVVNVGVGGDEDTDDYDPDSTSSEDDDSDVDINESDFDNDDDAMFDCNVDNDVEFIGLGKSEVTYDDTPVVDNLVNIDGDEDVVSNDELRSNDSNSDGEGGIDNGVKHAVFNENTDMVNPIFEVGMEFKTHAVFRDAVKEYAVKWGKEIKFLKSDRTQVRAKCKDGCPWDIYCAYVPNDLVYRVKTFKDVHSCVRSFNVKWVSTKWIVSHYSKRIKKNPTWPIPSLVATIESEKTVNVHPQKAYRARRISVEMLEGSSAQQFSLLNSYAAEILKTNVGTIVKLKVKPVPGSESEVKFKRFYICWGALKKGFMEGCRPVIGLDGCHLKGPHGGILLTAVGIDANNCIYPLAYAVVEKEKKKTWLWFLELFGEDLKIENSFRFTFMSDKQKGLIDSVSTLFPNASHRFCVRHMYNNFKGEFKGLVVKEILWKAARATTVPHFIKAMEEMKAVDPRACNWLCERPPVHWSRSHFDTFPKCDILLNNLCESYNSAILPAREQPIISMLERIRLILMETIHKRRDAMMRSKHPICPKIVKRIEKTKDELHNWIPRWFGSDHYEVYGPNGMQYRVNLINKSCGCRKWDISGVPCVHALASIKFLSQDPFNYVHECYKVDTYLKCYGNLLSPMNGRDLWPETDNPFMLPPDVKKRSGRPKKARRRELMSHKIQPN
ncbi:hypothetical protein RHMOL_Rhmol07G0136600 [Rhododendron molle]|uniref:Uncharacterized protein n=1 Tax=Rhododendron molle TaxID=49168 RepID=A0ACC0N1E2_RHOML|nr:hypothetical protein RHMOL_Rhmol07G0136600 [Rhododendron molle]